VFDLNDSTYTLGGVEFDKSLYETGIFTGRQAIKINIYNIYSIPSVRSKLKLDVDESADKLTVQQDIEIYKVFQTDELLKQLYHLQFLIDNIMKQKKF
jgi:hypothetical protein